MSQINAEGDLDLTRSAIERVLSDLEAQAVTDAAQAGRSMATPPYMLGFQQKTNPGHFPKY